MMRQEVIELGRLGPLPPSEKAGKENLQELISRYEKLIMSIEKPVTDEEARVLVTVFGSDDAFGLVWPLVALVESAPGWPLVDCLENTDNEWIQKLKQRLRNAARP
ncbi:MAG TPA: hypothetical protein VNO32_60430 [Candidatus Acidoferrum sp.]|nr:hypothetical protein [Candidatus Acidoferrum sp.]